MLRLSHSFSLVPRALSLSIAPALPLRCAPSPFSLSLSLSPFARARAALHNTHSHYLVLFTGRTARARQRERREIEDPARESWLVERDRERNNVRKRQEYVYTYGMLSARRYRSTPRERRLPRGEGRSERTERISSPRLLRQRCTPAAPGVRH